MGGTWCDRVESRLQSKNKSGRYHWRKQPGDLDHILSGILCLTSSNYGLSYAAFLMGVPTTSTVNQQAPISISTPYFAGYFGDTWRITPKLTLMPGIRYEYEYRPKEKHNYWKDPSRFVKA
jgi:outer membrane receptor protein involved in Fe transport